MPKHEAGPELRLQLAVMGDPIDHSLSPAMQQAALRAAGVGGTYVAMRVAPDALPRMMDIVRTEMRGCNVTIPHKEAIVSHLDILEPSAVTTAAVNTVVNDAGRLIGHNTDVVGFAAALAALHLPLAGRRAVVFGAGGSGRAVVGVLLAAGARVAVVNRSQARAQALARALDESIEVWEPTAPTLCTLIAEAALIVNTTPLGMKHLPSDSPLPPHAELTSDTAVVDLVYGRSTPLQQLAVARGCRVMDGLEMLVQQGAASFRLWTGLEPDLAVMREACRSRLAGEARRAGPAVRR